jgi:hypothetical protein
MWPRSATRDCRHSRDEQGGHVQLDGALADAELVGDGVGLAESPRKRDPFSSRH